MLPILGIVLAFMLIVALRLRNVDFSLSILGGSIIIAVTTSRPIEILISSGFSTVTDPLTFDIVAAVILITVLGYSLKETRMMAELMEGLRTVLPSRILLALIPAMFGLLSIPGGALMSAPFNEPEANRLGLKPEQKTFINVWFRHLWYWASPISPVPILAASLSGINLVTYLSAQLPIFFVTISIGVIVSWSFYKGVTTKARGPRGYRDVALGLAPIIATVVLSAIGLPVWCALIVGIAIVFILRRVPIGAAIRMVQEGTRWDIAISVVAMLFFRQVVTSSDSVNAVLEAANDLGIPFLLIITTVPLLVGALSGTPTMGIGIVFPLLLPIYRISAINLISIIYAGIISGYLASPMHLCLILTNSYYKSELNKVYRYLVPSAALLYSINVIYHLAMNGGIPI